MKIETMRLRKKKRSVMLVGFGQLSPEREEALTHTWALTQWDWRRLRSTKVPVSAQDGQMLEKLATISATPYGADARRAQALLVRLLLAKAAVEQAWAEFDRTNGPALLIEATNHARYAYARETRSLRWTDDLTAPTPLHPDLARARQLRPLGVGLKSAKAREAEHKRYARTVDIEFVRPHLFREIEPMVTTLLARGTEVREGLAAVRKTGKDLLWQAEKWSRSEAERALLPSVGEAATILRSLEAKFAAPGPAEVADLTLAVKQETEAQSEGEAAWRAHE